MNIADRALARQVVTAIAATGAKAPKVVTETYERTVRLGEATGNVGAPRDALALAVVDALEHDRDPAADPDVQRVLAANALANQGVEQMVNGFLFDTFRDVCADHADDIVTAWRGPFDQAVEILTAAHTRIGSTPLEDTATIMRRGDDIAAVWADATNAVKTVEAVNAGWQALGEFTRLAPNDPRYPVLRYAAVDYRTWTRLELERQRLAPWEAVRVGLDLSLPTIGEYRDRVANLERGRVTAGQEDAPVDTERSSIAGRRITVSS